LFSTSVKSFDFSDENIYCIAQLVGNNVSKMTPGYYSKLCGTTGFLIFLIKDALEHAGIIIDKKTNNSRIYKNLLYSQSKETDKMTKFKTLSEKMEN